MANTTIQLKSSTVTSAPTSLARAEPAYSYASNTFFIGTADGTGAIAIGGKFYIDQQQLAFNHANAAFGAANNATDTYVRNHANSAFIHANSAFASANNIDGINVTQNNSIASAFVHANAAFASANNIDAVNVTQNNSIASAFVHANAAFSAANNATDTYVRNHANAAFTRANNSLDANNGGTITGDVIINANLFVNGTTTYVNTVNQLIGDNIITLNADLPQNGNPTQDAGFEVERGIQPNSSILFIESAAKWSANNGNSSFFLADEAVAVYAANHANAAFGAANTGTNAVAAFNHANSSFFHANAAFTAANNATDTYVRNHANAAFDTANSAVAVNVTQNNSIASAFVHANAAFSAANNATDTYVRNHANSSFFHANSSFSHANAAFGVANTASSAATAAQGTADGAVAVNLTQNTNITTANNTAVSAFFHANAAFAAANVVSTASAAVFNGQGDGSTKSFNLGYAPVSDGSASVVSIDGLVQYETTYTITTANSSINFSDAPAAGERIRVLAYTSVNPYQLGVTGVTAGNYGTASSVAAFKVAANGQIESANNTAIAIGAGAITSGTLTVERGGSGAGTFTAKGVLIGQGTSAFTTASSGTEGHVLTIDASGAPVFSYISGGTF